jgi:hypothetical protein
MEAEKRIRIRMARRFRLLRSESGSRSWWCCGRPMRIDASGAAGRPVGPCYARLKLRLRGAWGGCCCHASRRCSCLVLVD